MSSNNRFVFAGLDDLKAALRTLPEDLVAEASGIVVETANGAAAKVRAVYEQHQARHWVKKGTWAAAGHLAKSVTVTQPGAGSFGVTMVVKVNDPLAWLFDYGSQARHWAGGKSTGAMWGKTPPTHIFAGTMARERRAMYRRLKDLVARHGLTVIGEP
jgi:hypothetical protein